MIGRIRGYQAEDSVFRGKRRRPALSMQDARDLADKLCAHFGVEPIYVLRTRRRHPMREGGSWFYPGTDTTPPRIALDLDAADWIVCHEVAHYVNDVRATAAGRKRTGHDRRWAAVYVEACEVSGMPPTYPKRLRAAFIRAGLLPTTERTTADD